MSFDTFFWKTDAEAPFAVLLRVVHRYCPPEYADWDRFKQVVQDPARYRVEEEMRRFKQELGEAIAEPDLIPGNRAHQTLYHAAEYDDGTDERFLRRLWRELYPEEPVPGGDDEFRSDLIAIISGEKPLLGSTVSEYTDHYPWDMRAPDADFARMIWQRKYPNEPIPGANHEAPPAREPE